MPPCVNPGAQPILEGVDDASQCLSHDQDGSDSAPALTGLFAACELRAIVLPHSRLAQSQKSPPQMCSHRESAAPTVSACGNRRVMTYRLRVRPPHFENVTRDR